MDTPQRIKKFLKKIHKDERYIANYCLTQTTCSLKGMGMADANKWARIILSECLDALHFVDNEAEINDLIFDAEKFEKPGMEAIYNTCDHLSELVDDYEPGVIKDAVLYSVSVMMESQDRDNFEKGYR